MTNDQKSNEGSLFKANHWPFQGAKLVTKANTSIDLIKKYKDFNNFDDFKREIRPYLYSIYDLVYEKCLKQKKNSMQKSNALLMDL